MPSTSGSDSLLLAAWFMRDTAFDRGAGTHTDRHRNTQRNLHDFVFKEAGTARGISPRRLAVGARLLDVAPARKTNRRDRDRAPITLLVPMQECDAFKRFEWTIIFGASTGGHRAPAVSEAASVRGVPTGQVLRSARNDCQRGMAWTARPR